MSWWTAWKEGEDKKERKLERQKMRVVSFFFFYSNLVSSTVLDFMLKDTAWAVVK